MQNKKILTCLRTPKQNFPPYLFSHFKKGNVIMKISHCRKFAIEL